MNADNIMEQLTPTNITVPPSSPAATQEINFDSIKTDIVNNDIIPTLKHDIDNSYTWRNYWARLSNVSSICVQFFTVISSILSFVATSKDNTKYSFIAGIFSVVTLCLTNFAIYSKKQQKEKADDINKYLQKLNIKFSIDDTEDKKS
jgi:large-conductance mechanosensitive channel